MDGALISVIVPIYKVEQFLPKCIDSIINQTYKNLEIILVDDGSPDRCGEICDEYAKKDSRIRVIHKKNGGLSDARNAGLDIASGEYIAFVDSDDYIVPYMYEKLYEAIKKNDSSIAVCRYKRIYADSKEKICEEDEIENISGWEVLNERMINSWGFWVVAWNKLYKRDMFNRIRYPKDKIHEDSFIIHELLYTADKIVCIRDVCYFYMQNEGSIQGEKYNIKRLDDIEAFLLRMEFGIEKGLSENMLSRNLDKLLIRCYQAYRMGDMKDPAFRARMIELRRRYKEDMRMLKSKNLCRAKQPQMLLFYLSPHISFLLYKSKGICEQFKRLLIRGE